jgi:maltose O-acetyltransferase
MAGRSIIIQVVNIIAGITPLTRWFGFRARMLRFAGVDCSYTARVVASAKILHTNLAIGNDTFIGHQVLIVGNGDARATIGNNVDIAPRVVIVTGTHDIDMTGPHSAGPGKGEPIRIEDGVWIGANATITPGVSIGFKAVIGAGSVVVNDIPPYCIAVGNPCRPIKRWNPETSRFDPILPDC